MKLVLCCPYVLVYNSRLYLQGMFLVRHRCIRDCRFPMAQNLLKGGAGQRGAGAARAQARLWEPKNY